MNLIGFVKRLIPFAIAGTSLVAKAITPGLDVTLNDFPPETKMGRYILEISSNEVFEVVKLTNGVLTVGNESINIAEPSHTVVETNVVEGQIIITTNTYYTVYEDGLKKTLKEYATNEKIVSIVTNDIGEVTTNWTKVAYLSDIPADEKKADKIIEVWDFREVNLGMNLVMVPNTNAPYAYWSWSGDEGQFTYINLYFTNGVWTVENSTSPPAYTNLPLTASILEFGGFTFVVTNRTNAMVVYTDQLDTIISGKFDQFVAKTNLVPIAEEITEERLLTIDGIAETLRGIKQVVNGITGVPTMSFTFTAPSQNFKCILTSADMVMTGDTVEIDWGDGSQPEHATIPTNHTYTAYEDDTVTVTIKGFVKRISGDSSNPFIYLSVGDDAQPSQLVSVNMDSSMPLEIVGENAFYNCGGLMSDLSFLPSTVTNLEESCFMYSAISSLMGMPVGISKIGSYSFYSSALTSLQGMSPSVTEISDFAFAGSALQSLNGISASLTTIKSGAFANCSSLMSLSGFESTLVRDIPFQCFNFAMSLDSLVGIPSGVTNIGASAFAYCNSLTSLMGIPDSLEKIESGAFQSCSSLQSADFGATSIKELGAGMFYGSQSLTSIVLPSTVTTIASDSFGDCGGGDTLSVTMAGRDMDSISNLTSFAWGIRNSGLSPGATVFIATDGHIVSDGSGGWTANLTSTAFSLTGIANNSVELGEIVPSYEPMMAARSSKRSAKRSSPSIATGTYAVDWGDGTLNTETSHAYSFSAPTSVTIKVLGVLDSISGTATKPFVSIDGSSTNEHLVAVDVGGAVGLKSIGDGTFRNCTALTAENIRGISSSLYSLGDECFAGCRGMTNIPWLASTSVTSLPDGCFRNSGIAVGGDSFKNIDSLGAYSFYGCTNITSVSFITNANITAIPDGCFQNCYELTTLPPLEGITSIGRDSFANCSKLVDFNLPRGLTIGNNAFYGCGTDPDIPEKTDDDGFKFKLLFDCPGMTYVETAQAFGLNDGDVTDTRTGIDPTVTKFLCDDGDLLFNNGEQIRRWEVIVPAVEFELSGVTNMTTFTVANTRAYDNASLVWNWGDGGVDRWITKAPANHTYTNAGTYVVKVKGLLQSISSPSAEAGAYIRPSIGNENPFLVGFKLADDTPLQAIGSHTFSRCPNLKNINTTNLPRSRAAPKIPEKREPSKTRLEDLSSSTTRGIVTYGEGCFARSGVVDLTGLPNYLSLIPLRMFAYDEDLPSLDGLPDSILDIEDEAFRGNTSLSTLYGYPSAVGYIPNYCFAEDTAITTLDGLQDSPIDTVGEGAFAGCRSLINLYGIPETVKSIGPGAFFATGLYSLTNMPYLVTNIEETAFAYCTNLKGITDLSTNVTTLGRMSFMGCTNVSEIMFIPNTNGVIGDYAFYINGNVTNVNIGDSVEKIGYQAFGGAGSFAESQPDDDGNLVACTITFNNSTCARIRELWATNFPETLPSTKLVGWDGYIIKRDGEWVDQINTFKFKVSVPAMAIVGYGNLTTATNGSANVIWGDDLPYDTDPDPSLAGNEHRYTTAGEYEIVFFGSHMLSFESSEPPLPFIYSTNATITLKGMEIGNACGIQRFGDSCFRGYANITSLWNTVDWPIVELGDYCFEGCTSLKSLDGIPSGIVSIGSNVFANCLSLADISALKGMNLYDIPESTFRNCRGLTGVSGLPSALTNICQDAFASCTALKSLDGIPDGVEAIGDHAFSNCTSLVSVDALTNSLSYFGKGCFMGCTSLTNINSFSGNLYVLPEDAFRDCTALKNIEGLPTFSVIGDSCFSNCTSLVDCGIVMQGQPYVPFGMFAGCSSITNLGFIPSTVTACSNSAFYGCTGLKDVNLVGSIEYVGDKAFGNWLYASNVVVNSETIAFHANALTRIGELNTPSKDEYGFEYKAAVRFRKHTCDQIKAIPNFPFGAPSATTKFIGTDGIVMYLDGKWEVLQVVAMIGMNPTAGETYELGHVTLHSGQSASILWGDGSSDKLGVAGKTISHRYTKTGPVTIWINGGVKEFAYSGVGSFICKKNGPYSLPDNYAVSSVHIPEGSSLEAFGDSAFAFCHSLTSLVVNSENLGVFKNMAFANCENLTNINFQSTSVSNFGTYAFYSNTKIKNLEWVPPTVAKISDGCFGECSSLVELSGVLDQIQEIPYRCFFNCASLGMNGVDIVCPVSVTNIGRQAFSGCRQLAHLILPETLQSIAADSFTNIGDGCPYRTDVLGNRYKGMVSMNYTMTSNFVRKTTYGGGVNYTVVGNFPFGAGTNTIFMCADGYCSYPSFQWISTEYGVLVHLKNISNGDVISIGGVSPNPKKQYEVSFGDGDTTNSLPQTHTYTRNIANCYFSIIGAVNKIADGGSPTTPWIRVNGGTAKIADVQILPVTELKEIGSGCFYGCSAIQTVDIKATTITNIGDKAFYGCSSLTGIDLGSVPTALGDAAFSNCGAMRTMSLDSRSFLNMATNVFTGLGANVSKTTVDVVPVYTNGFWLSGDDTYKYSVVQFSTRLAHELIAASPTLFGASHAVEFNTINGKTLYSNGQWRTEEDAIVYDAYLASQYSYAKSIAPGMYRLIKKRNEYMKPNFEFTGFDTSRYYFSIPTGKIWYSVPIEGGFNVWSTKVTVSPRSIRIGNLIDLKGFGEGAFSGYSSLTNITHGDSKVLPVTKIMDRAFSGCSSLGIGASKIKFPACTSFGESAFRRCNGLTDITWMNQSAVVGEKCFERCNGLTSLAGFPSNGQRQIPKMCFVDCQGLHSMIGIPNTITNISEYAFGNCLNLLDFSVWPQSLTDIGDFAFGPTGGMHNAYWPGTQCPAYIKNIRCTNVVFSLPPNIRNIGRFSLCGVAPSMFATTSIDITGMKDIKTLSASSFAGSPRIVFSGLSLDKVYRAFEDRFGQTATTMGFTFNYVTYGPELIRSWLMQGDLLCKDGYYDGIREYTSDYTWDRQFGYYKYVRKDGEYSSVVTLNMTGVPANKMMYARPNLDIGGTWGNGVPFVGTTNYIYATAGDYSASMYYPNKIIMDNLPTAFPVIGTTTYENPYVTSVKIGDIEKIGDYAFAGLRKCEEILITAASMPRIESHAFLDLGSGSASKSSTWGTSYKSVVRAEKITAAQFMTDLFPFGAPTTTMFVLQDGDLVYQGGQWVQKKSKMSYKIKYRATKSVSTTTTYNFSGTIKMQSGSGGSNVPQLIDTGHSWVDVNVTIGTHTMNLGYWQVNTAIQYPVQKNEVLNLELDVNKTYDETTAESYLGELQNAGILTEKVANREWKAYGKSVRLWNHIYQLVDLTIKKKTTSPIEYLPPVKLGPFHWRGGGSGNVNVAYVGDPYNFVQREIVQSGQTVTPKKNGNGEYECIVTLDGEIEKIDSFISQEKTLMRKAAGTSYYYPPSYAYDISWGDNPTIKEIGSWQNCYVSLNSVAFPNTITKFGDSCFSYDSFEWSRLYYVDEINNRPSYSSLTLPATLRWLPTSLEHIGNNCFTWQSQMLSYGLGRCTKLKTIGDYAFDSCSSLFYYGLSPTKTNKGYIPSSVETIGLNAFVNTWGSSQNNTRFVCFQGKTMDQILGMKGYPWLGNGVWGMNSSSPVFEELGGKLNGWSLNNLMPGYYLYGSDGYISQGDKKHKQNTGL